MQRPTLSILIFALCALVSSYGSAASKSAKAVKAQQNWAPMQYDDTGTGFAAGYQGTDPKRFHQLFKERIEALKKGEFETSEEFSRRTEDADVILAPISTQKDYAFRVQEIEPKYDADTQTYQFRGSVGDYSCGPAGLIGKDRSTFVCKVATVVMISDKYTGSNAYGASRVVNRIRGTALAIAIQNTSNVSGNVFDYPDGNGSIRLVDTLPMPLERAKTLKGDIGLLFIGNITSPRWVEGKALLVEPKVDHPSDIFFTTDALPFNLKKVVYYSLKTGEILAQRSFQ